MTELKCRLIVATTPINDQIISILRETLGDEETLKLLETDCITYIVGRLLNNGWFKKAFKSKYETAQIISSEHVFTILNDFMADPEELTPYDDEIVYWDDEKQDFVGDVVDSWPIDSYRMAYELVAAKISSDQTLIELVTGLMLAVQPGNAEHVFTNISRHTWILDYIVRIER